MTARVFLADDDGELRRELSRILQDHGLRVVGQAASGRELIAQLDRVACDAILLDVAMPDMDGLETLGALGRRARVPPVVMLSVHDGIESVDRSLALGAAGYVLKSAHPPQIVEAVMTAVSGGAYIQPSVARGIIDRHLRLAAAAPHRANVSPRQRELLRALAVGLGNKEIAHQLGLQEETVKGYLSDLYARIGASGRAPAVAWAMRHRLID